MRTILVQRTRSRQFFAVKFDDDDAALILQYQWHLIARPHGGFFASAHVEGKDGKRRQVMMHRLVLPDAKQIIHRNGNTLDNRRENLRPR